MNNTISMNRRQLGYLKWLTYYPLDIARLQKRWNRPTPYTRVVYMHDRIYVETRKHHDVCAIRIEVGDFPTLKDVANTFHGMGADMVHVTAECYVGSTPSDYLEINNREGVFWGTSDTHRHLQVTYPKSWGVPI